jgi:4-amino-4-deoxy-L-arabinose transferase-like glycosyltransferase
MSIHAISRLPSVCGDDRKPIWLSDRMFDLLSDPRRALVVVLLAACLIRFGLSLCLGPLIQMDGDVPSYIIPGIRLADGFGYTRLDGIPAMKRAPGFPLQIALSHWLTGDLYLAFLLNAAWGATAVLVVYGLGKRAFGGSAVGAVAAIIYAALPQPIYWQRQLLTESLHTLLILVWALGILKALEKGGLFHFVAAGLMLAAVLYVRPGSALLLVVPVFALLSRYTRKRAGWLLLSSFVALLAILPWSIRNYSLSGRVIPVATGSGVVAYLGNLGDGGNGSFSRDYPATPVAEDVIRRFQEAEKRSDWDADAYAQSLVPALLRDRLAHDFWAWVVKAKLANLCRFFFGRPFAVSSPWWSYYQSAVVLVGLALTTLSFPVLWRRVNPRGSLVFCWLLASLLCIHIATTSVRRYAEPILPFLALGSAAALLGYGPAWWNHLVVRRRLTSRTP